MSSIQGINRYFYAFYRRHNHISFKVTLRSGIKNKNFVFCFVIPLTCSNFADDFQKWKLKGCCIS